MMGGSDQSMRMTRPLLLSAALLFAGTGLSGCIAYTVASTATSVAATTVKTGAKVTGAVVGGTADALHTSDQERCVKEMKRRREDTRVCYERRR
jgi:hypothetical protein